MSFDITRHKLATAAVILATIAIAESFPAKADTVYKTVGIWQINYDQKESYTGCFMYANYKSGMSLGFGVYFMNKDTKWIDVGLFKDDWNIFTDDLGTVNLIIDGKNIPTLRNAQRGTDKLFLVDIGPSFQR